VFLEICWKDIQKLAQIVESQQKGPKNDAIGQRPCC